MKFWIFLAIVATVFLAECCLARMAACSLLVLPMCAVNLLNERRLTLNELAKREGVNPSTVWRWSIRGVRGVKLETFSVGSRRYTTSEAFERFVQGTTAVAQGEQPAPRTNQQRQAAIAQAERLLADDGI